MDDREFSELAFRMVSNLLVGGRHRLSGINGDGLVNGGGVSVLAVSKLAKASVNPQVITDPDVLEWVCWQDETIPGHFSGDMLDDAYDLAARETMCLLGVNARFVAPGVMVQAMADHVRFGQAMGRLRLVKPGMASNVDSRFSLAMRGWISGAPGAGYRHMLDCVKLLAANRIGLDYSRLAVELVRLHRNANDERKRVLRRWMDDYQGMQHPEDD